MVWRFEFVEFGDQFWSKIVKQFGPNSPVQWCFVTQADQGQIENLVHRMEQAMVECYRAERAYHRLEKVVVQLFGKAESMQKATAYPRL